MLESNPSAAPVTVQWGQSRYGSARCVCPIAPSKKAINSYLAWQSHLALRVKPLVT